MKYQTCIANAKPQFKGKVLFSSHILSEVVLAFMWCGTLKNPTVLLTKVRERLLHEEMRKKWKQNTLRLQAQAFCSVRQPRLMPFFLQTVISPRPETSQPWIAASLLKVVELQQLQMYFIKCYSEWTVSKGCSEYRVFRGWTDCFVAPQSLPKLSVNKHRCGSWRQTETLILNQTES